MIAQSRKGASDTASLRTVGTLENARAKAQASVSEAQAEVKRLEADLAAAEAKASLAKAGDSAVDLLTSAPVIRENTEFLRRRTEADSASAAAEVDRIQAELTTARSRLKWAQRSHDALEAVSNKVSAFLESAAESLSPGTENQAEAAKSDAAAIGSWSPAQSEALPPSPADLSNPEARPELQA